MNRKILTNSFWLFSAQALTKVVSFFYTIFLAKNLGVYDFGLFITSLAYFALLSSIADFGFNRFLVREGSKNPDKLPSYFINTALVRFGFNFLAFILFSFWLYLYDKDNLRVYLSLLAILATLPQSLALTLDTIFVVKQKLQFSALSLLSLSLLTSLSGVYFITSGLGPLGGVLALVLGQVGYLLCLILFLTANKVKLNFDYSFKIIKDVIKGSFPYGIIGVLGLLYFRIDTLLLSYLRGPEETGLYGAAYRFLEAIVFIPSALATAMFPLISKFHDEDIQKVKNLYFSSVKILAILSLPILLGYIFVIPYLIKILLPSYLSATEAIFILSFAIPFMFIHVPGALVLISSDKFLKEVILLSIFTLSFNIILNLLLIPDFGFIGASYVTVFSEILSFIVFFILLYRKILRYV